jgi:hypothetical protein
MPDVFSLGFMAAQQKADSEPHFEQVWTTVTGRAD